MKVYFWLLVGGTSMYALWFLVATVCLLAGIASALPSVIGGGSCTVLLGLFTYAATKAYGLLDD